MSKILEISDIEKLSLESILNMYRLGYRINSQINIGTYSCINGRCVPDAGGTFIEPTCRNSCHEQPPSISTTYDCVNNKCVPSRTGMFIEPTCGGLCEHSISCTSAWKCESPLNGYENDGCGNRRLNCNCNSLLMKCDTTKNFNIFGRCINKYNVYGSIGIGLIVLFILNQKYNIIGK